MTIVAAESNLGLVQTARYCRPDVYQKSVSSGTSFTVNLGYGVKGDIATAVKAEYYVAYLPTGTTDLTKLQFIGDKQGSFSGIPVFWKF